jgi:dTDP-4-amino-4,6-dideoxygalactose transaminase
MSTLSKIPFFGIERQYKSIRQEILNAYDEVLSSGQVMHGEKTVELEKKIAKMCDRKYAIALNNCSTALTLALVILNISTKSTVLCTAESYAATLNSIFSVGANPSLLDTDNAGLLAMDSLTKKEVSNADGLVYVNLYGNCIDYDKMLHIIRFFYSSEIPIIEDAAQSFGSSYKGIPSGKLGTVSCLSFDPTKNFNNFGSGGMVLTDDHHHMQHLKQMRSNGFENSFGGWNEYGMNARMSEMDAAALLVKLTHFDKWQKRRTEIAEYYNKELGNLGYIATPITTPDVVPNWSKYVIKVLDGRRYQLTQRLDDHNIENKIHYKHTLYQHTSLNKAYEYKSSKAYQNAITKMSLPIYPELTDSEVEYIVEVIRSL